MFHVISQDLVVLVVRAGMIDIPKEGLSEHRVPLNPLLSHHFPD